MSSAHMVIGSERASQKRSIAVFKTFQRLSQTSMLGAPGSSCRIQVPEATLKGMATWLSLHSARLPRGPNKVKPTWGSEPDRTS
eukprot:5804929-Alexandrium_andersonii.AAC.1